MHGMYIPWQSTYLFIAIARARLITEYPQEFDYVTCRLGLNSQTLYRRALKLMSDSSVIDRQKVACKWQQDSRYRHSGWNWGYISQGF